MIDASSGGSEAERSADVLWISVLSNVINKEGVPMWWTGWWVVWGTKCDRQTLDNGAEKRDVYTGEVTGEAEVGGDERQVMASAVLPEAAEAVAPVHPMFPKSTVW